MPLKILLLVGCAGFAGTLCRVWCVRAADRFLPGFPFGTLAVNIAGAFLAGFLFVLCRTKFQAYAEWFPVLFLGFLGAFTTFSTFALESTRFLADAQYMKFMVNVCLQNLTGLGAAWTGWIMGRMLFCR